jgi:PKHD-type hydroxylase
MAKTTKPALKKEASSSAATEARSKKPTKEFLTSTDTVTVVTTNQNQGAVNGGTSDASGPAIKPEFLPKPTADVASSFNWWLDLTTNENWAYAHDVFTKEECLKIIEIGSRGGDLATPLTYGSIGGGAQGSPSVEDTVKIRRSPVSWIRSDVAENRWIFERLVNHITSINKQFFNYDLTDIQSLQFTRYDGTEGGFYGKHIDMMYQGTGTRKLSVSIQLSDGADYEGGDLLLHTRDDAERPFKKQGTGIFFPSWTLHEVAPVTKGIRYSLVAWVQGPRFR